jgi:hypothetical protein
MSHILSKCGDSGTASDCEITSSDQETSRVLDVLTFA